MCVCVNANVCLSGCVNVCASVGGEKGTGKKIKYR